MTSPGPAVPILLLWHTSSAENRRPTDHTVFFLLGHLRKVTEQQTYQSMILMMSPRFGTTFGLSSRGGDSVGGAFSPESQLYPFRSEKLFTNSTISCLLILLHQIQLCGLDGAFFVKARQSFESELSTTDIVSTEDVTLCREDPETGEWEHSEYDCPKSIDKYAIPIVECTAENARDSQRRLAFLKNIDFMMNLFYRRPELAAEQKTLRCYQQPKFITTYG